MDKFYSRIQQHNTQIERIIYLFNLEKRAGKNYLRSILEVPEAQKRKRKSYNTIYKRDIDRLNKIHNTIIIGTFNLVKYISKKPEYKNYKQSLLDFHTAQLSSNGLRITTAKGNKIVQKYLSEFTKAKPLMLTEGKLLQLPEYNIEPVLLQLYEPEIVSGRDRKELLTFHRDVRLKYGHNSVESRAFIKFVTMKNNGLLNNKLHPKYLNKKATLSMFQKLLKEFGSVEELWENLV